MGNDCCTISPKIVPRRRPPSEESYRYDRPPPPPSVRSRPVVRFSSKNAYYSDNRFIFSVENLERRAKNMMMDRIMVVNRAVETPHDRTFIEELTRELIKAKAAMDETLYRDLPPVSHESFSIVPYSHIDD